MDLSVRTGNAIGIVHEHGTHLQLHYPGFLDALEKADKDEIDTESFTRQVLNSIKDTSDFLDDLPRLSTGLNQMLLDFMDGKSAEEVTRGGFKLPLSSGTKQHFDEMAVKFDALSTTFGGVKEGSMDGEEKPVVILSDVRFVNWGSTVTNTPKYTCIPTTVVGVQSIMALAIKENKRVRASGFRHTWSNMYSNDGEILVSLLSLSLATGSSSEVHENAVDGPPTEFNQIELYKEDIPGTGGKKRLARIGAGVTNEAFRIWAIANGWTLPLNVIMVEITIGGANAPICHGAGITHKTLSDLVREIEYVDVHGEVQTLGDPAMLKAAAGAFGLLGIVTHITFELDKMTYAMLSPIKQDVKLAIPPPAGYNIPAAVKWKYTEKQRLDAETAFIAKAQSFYAEWFWFAYQDRSWVNCWNNTEDATGAKDYPSKAAVFLQWAASKAAAILNSNYFFKKLPGHAQGSINSISAMATLPPTLLSTGQVKTQLINGLHFQRGIQNFPVLDTELQIPIPPLASDPSKPDWSVVQRAWWDAISLVFADMKKTGAMRLVLELRIMSSSDVIMAPQTGNKFGTASIEVLTNQAAAEDGSWRPFVQTIVDAWTAYEVNGEKLNVRPHWAKEWEGYTVGGVDWKTHMKTVSYKDEIVEFKTVLSSIGKLQGWTLEEAQERFSNPLLDSLYFQ